MKIAVIGAVAAGTSAAAKARRTNKAAEILIKFLKREQRFPMLAVVSLIIFRE